MIEKWIKRVGIVTLVCMLFVGICQGAEGLNLLNDREVRIGLTTKYYNKESLISSTSDLGIGYVINDEYKLDALLSENDDFVFQPIKGFFIMMDTVYEVYSEVEVKAKELQSKGYQAYPALKGYNKWYIYLGSYETLKTAQRDLKKAEKAYKNNEFTLIEDTGDRYKVSSGEKTIMIVEKDEYGQYPQYLGLNNELLIKLGDNQYRGRLEIGVFGQDSIGAINVIDMESYLYGVVPIEMPYDWAVEAHKAQAITARTFAYYNAFVRPKHKEDPYDLEDTTVDQAYRGYGIEKPNTNRAIDATKDQVITYNGNLISTYFFSTSGGRTENPKNIWGGTSPYLKSVSDTVETLYTEKPPWFFMNTVKELEKEFVEKGLDVGKLVDLEITAYAPSGRAIELMVTGTKGKFKLKNNEIRKMLGTRSTRFTIRKYNDDPPVFKTVNKDQKGANITLKDNKLRVITATSTSKGEKLSFTNNQIVAISSDNLYNYTDARPPKGSFLFIGMGNGHGVGMSQSGAQSMALNGASYKEIIEKYYSGVALYTLY